MGPLRQQVGSIGSTVPSEEVASGKNQVAAGLDKLRWLCLTALERQVETRSSLENAAAIFGEHGSLAVWRLGMTSCIQGSHRRWCVTRRSVADPLGSVDDLTRTAPETPKRTGLRLFLLVLLRVSTEPREARVGDRDSHPRIPGGPFRSATFCGCWSWRCAG